MELRTGNTKRKRMQGTYSLVEEVGTLHTVGIKLVGVTHSGEEDPGKAMFN